MNSRSEVGHEPGLFADITWTSDKGVGQIPYLRSLLKVQRYARRRG